MEPIISKEEIDKIIQSEPDCAYELFKKICKITDGTSASIAHLHQLYQMIYSTFVLEGEICNGGFYQYYGNSTAQEFNAMGIEGFKLIGANRTVNVLSNVYRTIMEQSPVLRNDFAVVGIQKAFNKANEKYGQICIDEYDKQFYSAIEEDDITKLRISYIKTVAMNGWIE